MNFELQITMPKAEPITWNYQVLRANLETALADYQNRVYTEDTIAEAKEDRAKLNKLKKAINDERIAREKEYMQPFLTFKDQAKELCDLIDTASSGIGEQLDAFEEKRIAEKHQAIETLFKDIISNYDLPFITLDKIYNEKWDNKSVSDKAIAKEITDICEKAVSDLVIIKRMPEYSFEAEQVYKETLNLVTALAEGERMSQIAKQKAEYAKIEAEKKKHLLVNAEPDSEEIFDVAFHCKVTKRQAIALSEFCKENGIVLQKISQII